MLTKIPGIDPTILQTVKERTAKQVVHNTKNLKVTDHEKKDRGRQWKKEGKKEELVFFLEELNKELEELEKPIRLQLIEEKGFWQVQVVDISSGKVLQKLSPQVAGYLLGRSLHSSGLLIDDKA